jgi:hypothetical protein
MLNGDQADTPPQVDRQEMMSYSYSQRFSVCVIRVNVLDTSPDPRGSLGLVAQAGNASPMRR